MPIEDMFKDLEIVDRTMAENGKKLDPHKPYGSIFVKYREEIMELIKNGQRYRTLTDMSGMAYESSAEYQFVGRLDEYVDHMDIVMKAEREYYEKT